MNYKYNGQKVQLKVNKTLKSYCILITGSGHRIYKDLHRTETNTQTPMNFVHNYRWTSKNSK